MLAVGFTAAKLQGPEVSVKARATDRVHGAQKLLPLVPGRAGAAEASGPLSMGKALKKSAGQGQRTVQGP